MYWHTTAIAGGDVVVSPDSPRVPRTLDIGGREVKFHTFAELTRLRSRADVRARAFELRDAAKEQLHLLPLTGDEVAWIIHAQVVLAHACARTDLSAASFGMPDGTLDAHSAGGSTVVYTRAATRVSG